MVPCGCGHTQAKGPIVKNCEISEISLSHAPCQICRVRPGRGCKLSDLPSALIYSSDLCIWKLLEIDPSTPPGSKVLSRKTAARVKDKGAGSHESKAFLRRKTPREAPDWDAPGSFHRPVRRRMHFHSGGIYGGLPLRNVDDRTWMHHAHCISSHLASLFGDGPFRVSSCI